MAKKPAASLASQHHCGRCTQFFSSRQALRKHLSNHSDSEPISHKCSICPFFFEDSLALEEHSILSGHPQTATPRHSLQYACDRCPQEFSTQRDYKRHRELGQPCCDANHARDWKKKSRPGHIDMKSPFREYIDLDKPQPVRREEPTLVYGVDSTATPSEMSDKGDYCHDCKKIFPSPAAYARHVLGCSAINVPPTPDSSPELLRTPDQDRKLYFAPTSPTTERHTLFINVPPPRTSKSTALEETSQPMALQTVALNVKPPVSRQSLRPLHELEKSLPAEIPVRHMSSLPATSSQAAAPTPLNSATFTCNFNGCQRSYNSEPGLKLHQTDAHGVGGPGLDLHGRDSWMLGQRERERLRAEGLLRTPPAGPARGSNSNRSTRARPTHASPAQTRAPLPAANSNHAPAVNRPSDQAPARHTDVNASPLLPTSQNVGGVLEMEQAKFVCGKTLRLLLQTNIFIHHDGKINVSGNDWTRIGVERQSAVVGMFDELCHLPRKLQPLEYVPAPKAFMKEYTAQYPVMEFKSTPARDPAKPGMGVIALTCSKIVLANGCQEVVKIAAVDVLTCRILMSHLVCVESHVKVSNWCSTITGLRDVKDIEDARKAGFKVLKGWFAARAALFSFIDKDTIIVGHNLRSDLDALRIIHGRAVDIAKLIEKAAQGPLSIVQIGLESWCREITKDVQLKADPVFGRDCLTNAFAVREIGLWAIKNQKRLETVAKQKTREYQTINPIRVLG